MKTIKVSIEQIRMARSLLQLSRKDVANSINMSSSTYGEIEKGKSDPRLSSFIKIVSFFEEKGITFKLDNTVNVNKHQ